MQGPLVSLRDSNKLSLISSFRRRPESSDTILGSSLRWNDDGSPAAAPLPGLGKVYVSMGVFLGSNLQDLEEA